MELRIELPAGALRPRPIARELLHTSIALIAIAAFVLWLVQPILDRPELPRSTDALGHLARVWYAADVLRAGGAFPQWFPAWYNGTPLLQYYPPLATYAMAFIQLVTQDLKATYVLYVVSCLTLAGWLTYRLARRWMEWPYALGAALIALGNPYTIYTVFPEGNLPRTLFLALMPLAIGATVDVLERDRRRDLVALAAVVAVMVLTHHMQAIMVLLLLGVIALGTARRLLGFVRFGAACLSGVGLAGAYLLPAVTRADYPNVPNVSVFPERLPRESAGLDLVTPWLRAESLELVYIGASLVVLALLAVLLTRSRWWLMCFVAGLVGIVLALGVNTPLYTALPFHDSLLPRRFLNVVVWLYALLAGMGVRSLARLATGGRVGAAPDAPQARTARPLAAVAVAVAIGAAVAADYMPYRQLIGTASFAPVSQALQNAALAGTGSRMALYVDGESELSLLPLLAGFAITDGYSPETTPHLDTILAARLAERTGYPAFVSRLQLDWDVGALVVDPRLGALRAAFADAGYAPSGSGTDRYELLAQPEPRPIQRLTRNAIVIGRGAPVTATVFPWISYGTSWNIDDYPEDYLEHFDLIYLYDFRYRDSARLGERIRAWVAGGKTVVLDMTAMPDSILLGVVPRTVTVPERPAFHTVPGADSLPAAVAGAPFGSAAEPWRGVTYSGLDGSLLDVADATGAQQSVFGYRDVGSGRVYFTGLNWVTHAFLTHDQQALDVLVALFARATPARALGQPAFAATERTPFADRWGFSYAAAEETMVMVSATWSPHWVARLDGQPLPVYNHEQLLALRLPAGEHAVSVEYQPTAIQWAGWAVSGAALALGALLVITFRRQHGWVRSLVASRSGPAGVLGEP